MSHAIVDGMKSYASRDGRVSVPYRCLGAFGALVLFGVMGLERGEAKSLSYGVGKVGI